MLKESGFRVTSQELIFNNQFQLISIEFEKQYYKLFLKARDLPSSDIEIFLFSNEHSKATFTGGIGTYVEEYIKCMGASKVGCCVLGDGQLIPSEENLHKFTIFPKILFGCAHPRKHSQKR